VKLQRLFEFAESVPDHDKYDLAIMLAGASIQTMVAASPAARRVYFLIEDRGIV